MKIIFFINAICYIEAMNLRKSFMLASIIVLLSSCGGSVSSSSEELSSSVESVSSKGSSSSSSSEDDKDIYDVSETDISHIDTENRLICLTFDDGPKTEYEGQILDAFDSFNKKYASSGFKAHGTFFYIGNNITDAKEETIKRAISSGFQIGNHTLSHQHLENMTEEQIKSEVAGTITNLKKYTELDDLMVRLPYGTYNSTVTSAINVPMINWTDGLDTLDWDGQSADQIYDTVMNNLVDGGIVLMHEGYSNTITALKRLLPSLYERGYQVVSINEYCKARNIKVKRHQVYTSFGELA